jgi:HlyD family secretion protein
VRFHGRALALAAAAVLLSLGIISSEATAGRAVSCLGRLEPGEGVLHLASPSGGGVIGELLVAEGDQVEANQLLATLVTRPVHAAEVERLHAELDLAQREAARLKRLANSNAASKVKYDSATIGVRIAQAGLKAARAQVTLSEIRAPISGEVLEVHARAGERVGFEGVLALGDTQRMMAVAEVYETDIGLIAIGQTARLSSPAIGKVLSGRVSRIGHKVGRMDVIGTDPIAKTDARVIEVRISIDDPEAARALTHLQLEIEIGQ